MTIASEAQLLLPSLLAQEDDIQFDSFGLDDACAAR
jgi:hypothetical protein